MLGRLLFNRIGALIIGVVLLGIGGFMLFDKSDPTCETANDMKPGDTCEITNKDGSKSLKTYEDMKNDGTTTSYIVLGIGAVALVGGVVANVRHASKKKEEAGTTPVASA